MGPLATPGMYTVTLYKRQAGALFVLGIPQSFKLKVLKNSPEITNNPQAVQNFHLNLTKLQRVVEGVSGKLKEINSRLAHLYKALELTTSADEKMRSELDSIREKLIQFKVKFNGDATISSRAEPVPWSVSQRVGRLFGGIIESQSDVPQGFKDSYEIAKSELSSSLKDFKIIEAELNAFEKDIEAKGAPWTPGRLPDLNN